MTDLDPGILVGVQLLTPGRVGAGIGPGLGTAIARRRTVAAWRGLRLLPPGFPGLWSVPIGSAAGPIGTLGLLEPALKSLLNAAAHLLKLVAQA